jgi:hypothetical protein
MAATGEMVFLDKSSEDEWVDLELDVCTVDEDDERRSSDDETPSLSSSTRSSILLDSDEEQSNLSIISSFQVIYTLPSINKIEKN